MATRRVAVIGAGAAGSMAAIFAASAGAETLLLERTADGGRKILISGGGRCNILPAQVDESRFVTDSSPNTLKKIVRSWPLPEQIAFFEQELGLPLAEEAESGKLFPVSNRARDVRDGLLALAARRGVGVRLNALVTGFAPSGDTWRVDLEDSPSVQTDAVVVATGGLSVPKTGSDGRGATILEQLGHTVHPMYAALTPILAESPPFAALAGGSLPVTVTARDGARRATASGAPPRRNRFADTIRDARKRSPRSRLPGAGRRGLQSGGGTSHRVRQSLGPRRPGTMRPRCR